MRNNKGVALITVYIAILTLTTIGIGFVAVGANALNQARIYKNSVSAFWLAEAGIADVHYQLNDASFRNGVGGIGSPTIVTGNLASGAYSASVYKTGTVFTVTSTGTVESINRVTRQTINVSEGGGFANYMLYFTNNSMLDTDVLDIGKDATINGSIFGNGDVVIGKDFYVDGDVSATGSITLGDGSTVTGQILPNLPEPPYPAPSLDPTPYSNMITTASGAPAGNQNISGIVSGTINVHGNATITSNITGPATIVATGLITINQDVSIGNDITLISGGNLSAQNNYVVGTGCTLYSSTLVDLSKEGGTFGAPSTGSVVITPGDVDISKGLGFYGLIFASGDVRLAKEATVNGNIAGNGTLHMAKDAVLTLDNTLIDFTSIQGFNTGGVLITPQKDWDDISNQ